LHLHVQVKVPGPKTEILNGLMLVLSGL